MLALILAPTQSRCAAPEGASPGSPEHQLLQLVVVLIPEDLHVHLELAEEPLALLQVHDHVGLVLHGLA